MKRLQVFCSDWDERCTLHVPAEMVWRVLCKGSHRGVLRGLPTRFATCPPRFALLLDLRKTRQQPSLGTVALPLKTPNTNPLLATGVAYLPQRSQGGAQRAGDMSGGRCAVSVAD